MTDAEVMDRYQKIHGSIPKGFDASQIDRFDGRIDWRVTNAAFSRAKKAEDQESRAEEERRNRPSNWQTFERNIGNRGMFDKAEEMIGSFASILPSSISSVIDGAFRKSRGWIDLSNAFGALAKDAKAVGTPFMGALGSIAKVAGATAMAAGVAAAAVGLPIAAIKGGLAIGERQTAAMTALAPFSAEMMGEVVSLEMSRFRRSMKMAENLEGTGSALLRSKDFLEQSLEPAKTAIGSVLNVIGTAAQGGVGFLANIASQAVGGASGLGTQQFDKLAGDLSFRLIEVLGGGGGMMFGGAMGDMIRRGDVMGNVPGPVRGMIADAIGAFAGVGNNDPQFAEDVDWLKRNAPEMGAALAIPSLMAGISGFFGWFGGFGADGAGRGVANVMAEGRKQAEKFNKERDDAIGSWFGAFDAIANQGVLADRDAHGPMWDVGPGVFTVVGAADETKRSARREREFVMRRNQRRRRAGLI